VITYEFLQRIGAWLRHDDMICDLAELCCCCVFYLAVFVM
jgi:hypothetical protein